MKKNSNSTNIWVIIILGVIVIIAIPFVINWLVPLNTPKWLLPVAGGVDEQNAWMGFWASYLGSIISACVAFFVLYITIRSNKEENKANRLVSQQQHKSLLDSQQVQLSYQLGKQDINTLRGICTDCYIAVSGPKTEQIYKYLLLGAEYLTGLENQIEVEERINTAYYKLTSFFPDKKDQDKYELESLENIDKLAREVFACTSDMYFLCNLYQQSEFPLTELNRVFDSIISYSDRRPSKFKPNADYKFLWEIVKENNWEDVHHFREQLIKKCLEYKKTVDSMLSHELLKLITYEERKNEEKRNSTINSIHRSLCASVIDMS